MIQQLAKNIEESYPIWDSLIIKAEEKYKHNSNFCNNIQFRGACLATTVLATVETVVFLAATIFSGLASLFTCCKNDSLKKLAGACALRSFRNGVFIPISIIGAIIHPNVADKVIQTLCSRQEVKRG